MAGYHSLVNIISYGEGGAHSTTQYMAMAEIEFRILDLRLCVENCVY